MGGESSICFFFAKDMLQTIHFHHLFPEIKKPAALGFGSPIEVDLQEMDPSGTVVPHLIDQ